MTKCKTTHYACECFLERMKAKNQAIDEAIEFVQSCMRNKASMGALNNAYLPQLDRRQVEELLDSLKKAREL